MKYSKPKKILITGGDGFIGKNLSYYLKSSNNSYKIDTFLRSQDLKSLQKKIKRSDFIFHLAGENRSNNDNDFKKNNSELTKQISEIVYKINSKEKRFIPIVYSSSTQAGKRNAYGKSKLQGEKALKNLYKSTKNPIAILRLPGVFGKWSKPNYNSVVATFCNNISKDIAIDIHNPKTIIELVYIDDLLKKFNSLIEKNFKTLIKPNIRPTYKVSLHKIAKLLYEFRDSRENLLIPNVGSGFTRALYSTYLSYLPPKKFSYSVKSHEDKRGNFVEFLKTKKSGQVSFFTAKPGIMRGEHFHHTKTEKFIIMQGSAEFQFRNIGTGKRYTLFTSDKENIIVDTIPGWAHNIKNVGKNELIVMLWANELFNPDHPDTYQYRI